MVIDPIANGIVLDHISAGHSMELYQILKLHKLKCSVAVITNVASRKMGRKDIIKIGEIIDLNF
ncbi:MAG: aspartate carbamoyltransferase regulatory subunit, partial [Mailhella sp.]|nr:aspartate carbamoyltransferase regulatory subunit [Mailhella sp.]